jgi:multicomponent Na+:H+ antiporter subunit F
MSPAEVLDAVSLALLGAAALLCAAWVVRARSLPDRAVGIDTMVATLVNAMAVAAALLSDGIFLELVLLTVVLGFLGTVAVARFGARRSR